MILNEKVEEIQKHLREQKIDGWLLYDNHGSNRLMRELLEIPPEEVLTRRFLYWIPHKGEPISILHRIEAEALNFLPGKKLTYLSWLELEKHLEVTLKKINTIAMEYSPRNSNPSISIVDAGMMEVIRDMDVEVISSADLLQHFTSVLNEEQMASHLEAASVLNKAIDRVWDMIADRLRLGKKLTEYDVQQFILSEFLAQNCITEDGPICAVNEHSSLPHYVAKKESAKVITLGDWILIDLWCKKNALHAVYADLTRVAVAAPEPTPRQQEIFEIVKNAVDHGVNFLRDRFSENLPVRGFEVDDICRNYIHKQGFGKEFIHRTGHNIDTNVHGAGAYLDNFESSDQRRILLGTCFSLEPGIYLPNEFGVRIEYDILVRHNGAVEITGGTEENIVCLL